MSRARKPTDEERALWRRVTEQVSPLRAPGYLVEAPSSKPEPAAPPQKKASRHSPPAPRSESQLPYLATGQTSSIDGRTADRLRRGRMEMEARLDLHGMSQADAHRALNAFILRAYADGRRTVLVITGKGLFTQGRGVLRDRLSDWLNMAPLRDKVLSYTPAQPKHGGGGAFYVLLKRDRGKAGLN